MEGAAPARSSPLRRARSAAMPGLVGVALAIGTTWPLSLHLGTRIGTDLGDPLFFTWQVSWIGHATLHQPLDLFQANVFWPLPDSLAFADSLVGFAPAAVFAGTGLRNALVLSTLLFLFSIALAFVGPYLLARELGTGRLGGLCAGVAFAFAPWILGHQGHLTIRSCGGIPLAIFLLLRGYRRQRARTVFAGWIVGAWQMLLGFAVGLQFAYLLAVLAAIAVVLGWQRRAAWLTRELIIATVAGILVLGIATFAHVRPYLRVVGDHPESKRSLAYVADLSPSWRGFLAAPPQSYVWGDATASVREPFRAPAEQSLFPGLTVVALAVVGALASVYPRRLRLGLALGCTVTAVLSTGVPRGPDSPVYLAPYRLLYDVAPGWNTFRTPGRVNLLTSLGLALLAAAGIVVVVGALRRRLAGRPRLAAAPTVVGLALVGAILVEGLGPTWVGTVPPPPEGHEAFGAPRLHLPPDISGYWGRYIVWTTEDFDPIVNGYGSFEPTENLELFAAIADFPDAASVERLQEVGVRTVVLHRDFADGTPWASVIDRPIDGLPITREIGEDVVVYRLRPAIEPIVGSR